MRRPEFHDENMANVVFGGKLRQNFNGFHVEENVGIGAAIYMKQEVDITDLGIEVLELIKSSVTYLANFGAKIGAPLSKDVELSLGISYQINGAPDEGKDFNSTFKSQRNIILGLTLDIGF